MEEKELKEAAIKCLIDNFGVVQAERFISLMQKESFDYTKWQEHLFEDMSVEELFNAASNWQKQNG